MIKPWILNMNMTKSLKPQKTISNLITRFMFNSGLCEYTPSHQRFNHRWFRGSSIRYIQITQITRITWHSNSFFIFLDCREKNQNIHSIWVSRLKAGFLPNCFLKLGLNRFLRKNGFGFLFRYFIFFGFRARFNIAGWNLNGSLVIYTCVQAFMKTS